MYVTERITNMSEFEKKIHLLKQYSKKIEIHLDNNDFDIAKGILGDLQNFLDEILEFEFEIKHTTFPQEQDKDVH